MNVTPYPDCLSSFVDEYSALVRSLGPYLDYDDLRDLLMCESAWTKRGSGALIMLARKYGTSVLANALALAEALEIEDGEAGI